MKDRTIAIVSKLPDCQFCRHVARRKPTPARYDFRTTTGAWANGCEEHYKIHRAYTTLGTGKGQRLEMNSEKPTRHPLLTKTPPPAPKPAKPASPRRFIVCPHCGGKSRKLSSYMGGVQMRRCTSNRCGRHFEIDTWMGMRSYIR